MRSLQGAVCPVPVLTFTQSTPLGSVWLASQLMVGLVLSPDTVTLVGAVGSAKADKKLVDTTMVMARAIGRMTANLIFLKV